MNIASLRIKVSSRRLHDVQEIMHSIVGLIKGQPGCISCRFYRNINSPQEIFVITEWQSEAYLDRYIATEEYRKFLALIDISEEQPEVKFHTVSKISGLEKIGEIRLGKESRKNLE